MDFPCETGNTSDQTTFPECTISKEKWLCNQIIAKHSENPLHLAKDYKIVRPYRPFMQEEISLFLNWSIIPAQEAVILI